MDGSVGVVGVFVVIAMCDNYGGYVNGVVVGDGGDEWLMQEVVLVLV